jgi:DNA processing protein
VQRFERYHSEHPDYPVELSRLTYPPPFTATGPLRRVRAVAIVGSREPLHEAAVFAGELARELAAAGITIVSGGAKGIDAAAHRGALAANGATWVVCPTGRNHVYPPQHRELFDDIAKSPSGRLIWPFDDDVDAARANYKERNGLLVALSETVVVIQAGLRSGSRNACSWARQLDKSLWVVAGPPWGHWGHEFAGSAEVLRNDPKAQLLGSKAQLLGHLGLAPATAPTPKRERGPKPQPGTPTLFLCAPRRVLPDESLTKEENAILSVVSHAPKHREILAEKAGLPIGPASTALLTLSLKDVVVEGPDGFYRRTLAS